MLVNSLHPAPQSPAPRAASTVCLDPMGILSNDEFEFEDQRGSLPPSPTPVTARAQAVARNSATTQGEISKSPLPQLGHLSMLTYLQTIV